MPDDKPSVLKGPIAVTLLRRGEQEPLKFNCLDFRFQGGFVIFTLEWFKGHKTLAFPADTVSVVETLDEAAQAGYSGYRESSTFREQPGTSPWFPAMGSANSG